MSFSLSKKRNQSGTHVIKLYDGVYLGKSQREVPKVLALTFTEETVKLVLSSKQYKYNNATIEKL